MDTLQQEAGTHHAALHRLIYGIDYLSRTVGHSFAWCIAILTLGTCFEVLVLYVMFFFPGILALVIAGWGYGTESTRILEVRENGP